MIKKYTKVGGVKILYKFAYEITPLMRWEILKLIEKGWISTTLPNGGWWIKAKYQEV